LKGSARSRRAASWSFTSGNTARRPGSRWTTDLGYLSRFALPHLPTGVTLFFTLSGYLLYRPIAASLLATGQVPGVRNYLRNRALRILPAYWVVLTAVAVILPAALPRLSSSDSSSELALDRLTDHPGILLSNTLLAGLASYSLFLWHEPTTRLLTEQGLTLGAAAASSPTSGSSRWPAACSPRPRTGSWSGPRSPARPAPQPHRVRQAPQLTKRRPKPIEAGKPPSRMRKLALIRTA
jgi:peptidoglycan/LPS O-acetylase OafA/YrhL